MKKLLYPLSLTLTAFIILLSCSPDEETQAPTNNVQTTTPEPETVVVQYTLTVTAGEGGSVTNGGTFDEGTESTITATPSEGYGFIGWEGSDSSDSSILITLNSNVELSAQFALLPQLILTSIPSKMFTKGIVDTLSIGFSHLGGYQSTSVSSEYGNTSIISQPSEGDLEGTIVIEYTPNTLQNVEWSTTIAGFDDIEINIVGDDGLISSSIFQVRTQPEPIFKDYLQPSHDLFATRNRADLNLIRYLNKRDNSYEMFCNGDETNYYNTSGNYFDDTDGVAYADFNGDGYDDILLHPTYTTYRFGGYSTVKMEYELYLYTNGNYTYSQIDWGTKDAPKSNLARKIIVGDFDNDNDPDVYAAALGLDIPPYTGEPGLFIINNLNVNQTFNYKEIELVSGAHEASSADIDGDGDLDIFTVGLRDSAPQRNYVSKFLKNNGNFNLSIWEDVISSNNHPFWSWRSTYHSELKDVDKDGFIDLIVMGHEWDYMYNVCTENGDDTCGLGKIYWGDSKGEFDETRKSLIPIIRNYGTSTDIDIIDLDGDGVNEIIITRTGGDIDSFPIESDNMNDNFSESNGVSYFYGGHYIQISKLTENREIIDVSSQLIEDNVNSNALNMCSPEDGWFYNTRLEDYDGNGSLNLFNSLVNYRIQHIWEWNGSKFIKISP